MPTYEYLCKTCSHRFETWQKMTDEPLTVCPECGGTIRRVLFPAGVVFKGSGFYKTDHGNGALANNKSEDGAKPASEGSTSESGAKSETPSTASASSTSSSSEGSSSKTSESKPAATSGSSKVA